MNEKQLKTKQKGQTILFILLIIGMTFASSAITGFNILHGIATLPEALGWIFSNLFITQESLERMPGILEKLLETVLMSVAATTTGTVVAFFLGLMGSKSTGTNRAIGAFARFVASVSRNIPVVAWALVLLLSLGQNSLTGYLALFVGSVGFLTRAFIESIDETSRSAVEALQATDTIYFQIIFKAVLPQSMPQMISWVLFMIETNIRNATLVGILTGTGIGYAFDLSYKTLNYNAVALVTFSIVLAVILIELISNHIRKVIL